MLIMTLSTCYSQKTGVKIVSMHLTIHQNPCEEQVQKIECFVKLTYWENERVIIGIQIYMIQKHFHFFTMAFKRWKHPILDQETLHEADGM